MNKKEIEDITSASSRQIDELVKKMRVLLLEGWNPYGNIFKDEDGWFCMLMVKYED